VGNTTSFALQEGRLGKRTTEQQDQTLKDHVPAAYIFFISSSFSFSFFPHQKKEQKQKDMKSRVRSRLPVPLVGQLLSLSHFAGQQRLKALSLCKARQPLLLSRPAATDAAADKTTAQWPYSITREVDWGELDAFNHVNNVVYFRTKA